MWIIHTVHCDRYIASNFKGNAIEGTVFKERPFVVADHNQGYVDFCSILVFDCKTSNFNITLTRPCSIDKMFPRIFREQMNMCIIIAIYVLKSVTLGA